MKKIVRVARASCAHLMILVLFLFSCSTGLKGQTMNGLDSTYFPLQKGNYWKYHYKGMQEATVEIRIEDQQTINGKQYFQFSKWFTLTPSQEPVWLAWESGTIHTWNGREEQKIIGPGLPDTSLNRNADPVTTPAGTFSDIVQFRNCLGCSDAGSAFSFARKIGVVSVSMEAIWGVAVYELEETNQTNSR